MKPSTVYVQGAKFGKLTLVEKIASGSGETKWRCQCECGNFRDVHIAVLARGYNISCGCSRGNTGRRVSDAQALVKSFRAGVRWTIELTDDELVTLLTGDCHYCGAKPKPRNVRTGNDGGRWVNGNGIDRVNSELGYVAGNVVSCCPTCNTMKMALTVDEWIAHMHRILEHLHR